MQKPGSYLGTAVASATVLVLAATPAMASAGRHEPPARSQLRQELAAVVAAGATGVTAQVDEGSIFGLGLIRHRLSCGVTAWGKDGDAPGYSTWSFSMPDNRKRITVSVTGGTGDPDGAVDAVLDAELCRWGRRRASRSGAASER